MLALSGCGVRFLYNRLDWLIPWYLSDYMELSARQEALFDARLEAYLDWHRRDQLPQYAAFLEQVAQQVEQGLDREQIAAIEARTGELAQTLVDRMLEDLIQLLGTVNDRQVEQLFQQLEEDNREYRQEYVDLSADEQRQQRLRDVIRYAERWTGPLTAEQEARLGEWADRFALMGPEVERARLAWQYELRRILEMRGQPEVYAAAFRSLIANPDIGYTPELDAKLAHNSELVVDLYLELDETLTPRQRRHMVDKLRDYAEDFRILSRQ
ncbi:MAG: DUF6279 family lipoprotein [Pseudomonadota bacterium]|nr:hypothetical protein [Pseudomonadales bacterium]MDY6920282.1 DUF6279 family lipoprotein [Pseudomonadota bacterium]